MKRCAQCGKVYTSRDLTPAGNIPAHSDFWRTCPGSYKAPEEAQ